MSIFRKCHMKLFLIIQVGDELVKQKNDQLVAIEYLTKYIDNIIEEEGLSAEKISEAKREHKEMLSEIRSVKESLDEIVAAGGVE